MITSKFEVAKHGLPYTNGSFKFKVGPVSCSVLCGGISYTALDYFYTGIKPPTSPKTPADGNPMEKYLYARQATAHYYTWHKFAAAWSGAIPILSLGLAPLTAVAVQDSIFDLANYLTGRPVILCLYGGMTEGHHVVAFACDPDAGRIFIYDSNHPGVTSVLMKFADGWNHSVSGKTWRGWFMDWGHYTKGVQMPPLAFRYCRTCHNLHTPSLGEAGACAAGGHADNPDLEYFLPWTGEGTQGGWTVCGQCMGLYRPTPERVAWCPAGGMHSPQSQNANWKEVRIATSGQGESGWRRCKNCCSLFWINPTTGNGTCGAGGQHDPIQGEAYVLDCRTV